MEGSLRKSGQRVRISGSVELELLKTKVPKPRPQQAGY
jgi:hypothetical protein